MKIMPKNFNNSLIYLNLTPADVFFTNSLIYVNLTRADVSFVNLLIYVNLMPADVFYGRGSAILSQREKIKRNTLAVRRKMHHNNHAKQLTQMS